MNFLIYSLVAQSLNLPNNTVLVFIFFFFCDPVRKPHGYLFQWEGLTLTAGTVRSSVNITEGRFRGQTTLLQYFLSMLFSIVNVITCLGNFTVVVTVISNLWLYNTMYFLLDSLAILDTSDDSANAPNLLMMIFSDLMRLWVQQALSVLTCL